MTMGVMFIVMVSIPSAGEKGILILSLQQSSMVNGWGA